MILSSDGAMISRFAKQALTEIVKKEMGSTCALSVDIQRSTSCCRRLLKSFDHVHLWQRLQGSMLCWRHNQHTLSWRRCLVSGFPCLCIFGTSFPDVSAAKHRWKNRWAKAYQFCSFLAKDQPGHISTHQTFGNPNHSGFQLSLLFVLLNRAILRSQLQASRQPSVATPTPTMRCKQTEVSYRSRSAFHQSITDVGHFFSTNMSPFLMSDVVGFEKLQRSHGQGAKPRRSPHQPETLKNHKMQLT